MEVHFQIRVGSPTALISGDLDLRMAPTDETALFVAEMLVKSMIAALPADDSTYQWSLWEKSTTLKNERSG